MSDINARLETSEHIFLKILKDRYDAVQAAKEIRSGIIRLVVKSSFNITGISYHELEDSVNSVISRKLDVQEQIISRERAGDIDLVPETEKTIRIISIGDFDTQPCINPHVNNTSEIGRFKIISIKKKGKNTYQIKSTVQDIKGDTNMKKQKFELQLAKGTRDFPPEEKILRDRIFNTIINVLERYGFNPMENPILERYETLSAKYAAGEASDALREVFTCTDNGGRKLGLRFDLTVPFSRFIGMNPEIKMPFKKYVVGEVFRDGPLKKGRYRQFTQFDPDIVGTTDVLADAEIMAVTAEIFRELGFRFEIEFNNRKLLNGILEDLEVKKSLRMDAIISIDKFKKIGVTGVKEELLEKGIDSEKIKKLFRYLEMKKTNKDTLDELNGIVKSPVGKQGLEEIEQILSYLTEFRVVEAVFLPSLARGLAYYTGPIFEVFLKDSSISSSAAGGGRYDELIGNFLGGKQKIPATGISYGIEVIAEALKEKQKISKRSVAEAYIIPIKTRVKCISIARQLREAGINADMDIMDRSISKNLQYANAYSIPYVLFVGQKELDQEKVKLRDMKTGEEEMLSIREVIERLKIK